MAAFGRPQVGLMLASFGPALAAPREQMQRPPSGWYELPDMMAPDTETSNSLQVIRIIVK